jgi:cyanate permease
MGMGLGLMLGPMISATVLSPLLGGWKPVLSLYGAVSIFIGVLWLVRWNKDDRNVGRTQQLRATQFREGIADLVRAKSLWLIGLALLFRSGGTIGFVGYLPLYLRQIGWDGAYADGALAAFFAISTLAVIPISFLSDRIHSRKTILFLASTTGIFGIGLIPLARGLAVWVLVLAVGLFFDAFMSVIVTLAQETKGVGLTYPGMTLGLIFTFSQVGSFIAPPLGNSLSNFHPGLPFLFWSLLSLFIVIALIPVKEDARRSSHS